MLNGRKLAARLVRRQQEWDNLKDDGGSAKVKYVKGYGSFRKPGSEHK